MKIKLKYIPRALKSQLPIGRFIKNFLVTGNAWGMFSRRAHYTYKGKEKVPYNTLETATKSAESMRKKYGNTFSPYYCPFCGKYHIGKNRDDRLRQYEVTSFYINYNCHVTEIVMANNEDHAKRIVMDMNCPKGEIEYVIKLVT